MQLEDKRGNKKPTGTKRRKLIAQTYAALVQEVGDGSFAIRQSFIHSFITASDRTFCTWCCRPIQNLGVAFDHFSRHRIQYLSCNQ
jgi:threonine dehydratase